MYDYYGDIMKDNTTLPTTTANSYIFCYFLPIPHYASFYYLPYTIESSDGTSYEKNNI